MITAKFTNAIRHQASLANAQQTFLTTGVVTGYDPDNYLVTVQTDAPDSENDFPGSQTGWIPVGAIWVGNGYGLYAPPNLGDICSVFYFEGDSQSLFCGPRFFGDTARPLSVQSGEFWVVHQSGSFFKLTNDGKLALNGNVEIDLTSPVVNITVTGNCGINAQNVNVNATQDINLTATETINILAPTVNIGASGGSFSGLLASAAATVFNNHTHDTETIGPPDQKMDSSSQTSNTKAT